MPPMPPMPRYVFDYDGNGDWSLFRDDPKRPVQIARKCDLHEEAWTLLLDGVLHRLDHSTEES